MASRVACRSSETGFLQKTCLPARLARMISSACVPVGVAIATASIASSASMSSCDGAADTPNCSPTRRAAPSSASKTQARVADGHRAERLAAWIRPMRPRPATGW